MRRSALAAFLRSTWQAPALVFGLLAMAWGYYLGTHGGSYGYGCGGGAVVDQNPRGVTQHLLHLLILWHPSCSYSPHSDLVAGAVFFPGLVTTVFIVSRNLPRRLSERVGGDVPHVWR